MWARRVSGCLAGLAMENQLLKLKIERLEAQLRRDK